MLARAKPFIPKTQFHWLASGPFAPALRSKASRELAIPTRGFALGEVLGAGALRQGVQQLIRLHYFTILETAETISSQAEDDVKKLRLSVLLLALAGSVFAQAILEDERYVPETDPLVLDKLQSWQDIKFGLLMHWGPYSQWGIVESWSICPEDYGWCERTKGSNPADYNTYKREYEALKNSFNPSAFNPERWAAAAKDAGMRYVVFTTKHHDGFAMFDTRYSDYKITDPDCPFSSHPKANITKEIFEAFRAEDMWVGAYFSKPDWHHPAYWDPYFPPQDRNVNYDPALYPDKWETYVQYTQNQILELLSDYGKVDIIWLDGGWVKKRDRQNIEENYAEKFEENEAGNGFIKHRIVSQDIRMDELVAKARQLQPGLIVVDRAVYGKNQNYLTPENRVPQQALPYPWESCIISGGGWSYTPDAKYMSGREAVQMLVDIVAKGGNLLLNIAPSPEGEWQQGAHGCHIEGDGRGAGWGSGLHQVR